jgi:hypothetical protein
MCAMLCKIDENNIDVNIIKAASDALINGGLAVFPTETVYGIGADAFNERALKSLGYDREWLKKRLDERHCRAEELFLMTVGDDGVINIIKEEK